MTTIFAQNDNFIHPGKIWPFETNHVIQEGTEVNQNTSYLGTSDSFMAREEIECAVYDALL